MFIIVKFIRIFFLQQCTHDFAYDNVLNQIIIKKLFFIQVQEKKEKSSSSCSTYSLIIM